jgi:amidase
MTDPHLASSPKGFLTATRCLEQLNDGSLTSVELVQTLLERINAIDDPSSEIGLRSIAALATDALDIARERDAERLSGSLRGPLHGLPVLIKDNIEALGLPGWAGSLSLKGRPSRDAGLVRRLRAAGAIILGSTNLSEWANIRSTRSTSGYSATGGLVVNPWALDRSAGGSSSGSGAALGAGLAPLAVGTETDGSIVCPASLNGVVGLKPTVGSVPTEYVVPISASQDSPGPMGRSVDDVALLFSVLADQTEQRFDKVPSLALAINWNTGHPQTDGLFGQVVEDIRTSGIEVFDRWMAFPGPQEYADELTVLLSELVDDLGDYLADRPGEGVRSLSDVVAFENEHRDEELRHFGHENFLQALASGGRRSPEYQLARTRNVEWATTTCLEPGLADVDAIIAPAYGPAWKNDLTIGGHPAVVSVATMAPAIAGWPIMSVPIGFLDGLPVGLAIIGRPHSEWLLLEIARSIEAIASQRISGLLPSFRGPERS